MKIRDFYKEFEALSWGGAARAYAGSEPCSLPTVDEIVIESVRIEDDSLSLRIHGETSDLLFQMPNEKSAERLCGLLCAHLTLDGPLSLRQLGDIDLNS